MRRSRLLKFLGLGMVVVVAGIVLVGTLLPDAEVPLLGITGGIALAEPAFASTTDSNFLEQEAGIAAYADYARQLNLAKAKEKFRTIERETDTYIVGSVGLLGYTEDEDVHMFVHRDGWLVAYYTKHEPACRMIDWARYSPPVFGTKLALALDSLTGHLDLEHKAPGYYAFNYPEANRLMLIADRASFHVTIPGTVIVHERAISYSRNSGKESKYLRLAPGELSLDFRHLVDFEMGFYIYSQSYARINGERKLTLSRSDLLDGVGISLVYREP